MTNAKQSGDSIYIALVSAAILAYEVLLTRILLVHYWSYFAAMIVSLAMLGFAASGTALHLASRRKNGAGPLLPWMTVCFAAALPVCPRLAETIRCMPLVVLWKPLELLPIAGHYLVLSLPFFFGGFIVGHFFVAGGHRAGHVYFANMVGAGAGVLIALLLLCRISPSVALPLAALPVAAAAWFRATSRAQRTAAVVTALVLPLPAYFTPATPAMSEYKELSGLLLAPEARIEHESWNPFGYFSVVDSPVIRYAPGLSLSYPGVIPRQKAILTNGDGMQAVCGLDDLSAARPFFDSMLGGLAHRFHERPRVLVAGAGAGMDVLAALAHGAAHVDALEHTTAIVRLMTGPLSEFAGNPYGRSDVRLIVAGARDYLDATTNRYDLVVVPAKRSMFASAAGTSAQDPDYLLTREALADFLAVLSPGGLLALETWLSLPPRHSAKLFATAADALRAGGLEPERRLMAVRSLRTSLLLVFRDPIGPDQVALTKAFCEEHSFDRVYHPGLATEDVNRFNHVEDAPYHTASLDLLRDRESAYRRSVFEIRPPTDDRPYFAHFFKWAALPELLSKTGRNVAVHVGWGYMFLLITLVQALPLGGLLILAPLYAARRTGATGATGTTRYPHRWRVYGYFSALAFGFMFLELAAIQQFSRFLPHPIYAFGATIGVVLLFSGLGARFSGDWAVRRRRVFVIIIGLMLTHLVLWRVAIGLRSMTLFQADVLTLALLSFFMGMPFPCAMERLRSCAPELTPWAWGLNGFFSVLAVLTAGLVSLSFGLSALVGLAAACYAVAAVAFPPALNT